jgi:formylmethanofuran dehydrogenase subunit E
VNKLIELLEKSAQYHRHLCPRQVLGVRMGLFAGQILGLTVPQPDKVKRIFTIVETDGCGADGVSVATNCWIGRRTLRVEDFGKVAASFVDTQTGQAIRIVPRNDARQKAFAYAPEARNKWEAMLHGYQRMPALELLSFQPIILRTPLEDILSRPGLKTHCEICSEEIINEREVEHGGQILCRPCAGFSYYDCAQDSELEQIFSQKLLETNSLMGATLLD